MQSWTDARGADSCIWEAERSSLGLLQPGRAPRASLGIDKHANSRYTLSILCSIQALTSRDNRQRIPFLPRGVLAAIARDCIHFSRI